MLYTVDCHCSRPKSCCILLLDETKEGTTSITNLDGESGEKNTQICHFCEQDNCVIKGRWHYISVTHYKAGAHEMKRPSCPE